MENKQTNKTLNLLPVYFKKVGVIVMTLAILLIVIFVMIKSSLSESQKSILSFSVYDVFTLGLSLIVFSKDKVEDEMSDILRYRAMLFAFMFTILSVMITPIFNLLFNEANIDNGREIVFTMLILYLVMYYFQKVRVTKRRTN